MVADAGTPFRPAVTPELKSFQVRRAVGLSGTHLKISRRQLAVIIPGHAEQIVVRYPAAGRNIFRYRAQAFTVFDDVTAFGNVCQCDFVAIGDILFRHNGADFLSLPVNGLAACRNFRHAGDHIIGGVHHESIDFHGVFLLHTYNLL